MNQFGLLCSVLVIAILVAVIASAEGDNSTTRDKRRKKQCKCVKSFIEDVDDLIEEKLKRFEEKYFRTNRLNQVFDANFDVDRKLARLDNEVQETKGSLLKLADSLKALKEQMHLQSQASELLTANFVHLDTLVRNLTVFVERLEDLIPGSPKAGMVTRADRTLQSTTTPFVYPQNCDEVYQRVGRRYLEDFYIFIQPDASPQPFKVLCTIRNNSAWTVIQKRQDGSVDFFRNWADYKSGFGSLEDEFWLGNDNIHYLTVKGDGVLRIEMEDWSGRVFTATYNHFKIADEKDNYKININGYHGDAGDSMTSYWENHDGMQFSTKDRDNDGRYYDSCAQHYHGAWWFNNCFDSHLNGKYYTKGSHSNYFQRDGIQWNSIHQYSSLKRVLMMVQPKSFTVHPVV